MILLCNQPLLKDITVGLMAFGVWKGMLLSGLFELVSPDSVLGINIMADWAGHIIFMASNWSIRSSRRVVDGILWRLHGII
jgi:hypothetical protein